MAKEPERGIVIGNKKFWSMAYADDVTLVASIITGLKGIIRRFEKCVRRKGSELNVEKSQIINK